jgi:hypothetical protein
VVEQKSGCCPPWKFPVYLLSACSSWHQVVQEKSDLNARFDEGRVPVHRLIFIRQTVYNPTTRATLPLIRRLVQGVFPSLRMEQGSSIV